MTQELLQQMYIDNGVFVWGIKPSNYNIGDIGRETGKIYDTLVRAGIISGPDTKDIGHHPEDTPNLHNNEWMVNYVNYRKSEGEPTKTMFSSDGIVNQIYLEKYIVNGIEPLIGDLENQRLLSVLVYNIGIRNNKPEVAMASSTEFKNFQFNPYFSKLKDVSLNPVEDVIGYVGLATLDQEVSRSII